MCSTVRHPKLENSIRGDAMLTPNIQQQIAVEAIRNLKKQDIVFKHPSCTHSGYCGTHYHGSGGGGWCYYCRTCNPR